MKTRTRILFILGICVPIILLGAAVIGYQDWQLRGSAPSNPASGYLRMWADNSAGKFKCLDHSGAACFFDSNSATVTHSIGATFDGAGSALTTGTKAYVTVPYACTIQAWNITVDTGTITIDAWKKATGTAIPTISDSITASATPAISTGTALHSTTLTSWTTSVSANDIFAFDITAVSSATKASLTLQCQ